jgi:hypothetical protein
LVEVVKRTRIACGTDHPVTAPGELDADGAADPATGAGDEDR